ncbi:MAG: hypothetical protein Q4E13_11490 [Clostridia bacterium]|nr:hypothetical protein [Clostridia bacterium]
MKTVYVLLTKNDTSYSRLIGAVTGDEFTHAALVLDDRISEIYSFSRRWTRLALPAGFERESLHCGVYGRNPDVPCALFAVEMEESAYGRMRDGLRRMLCEKRAHGYNLLGAMSCGLGRPHVSRHGRMFCSEFVAGTLQRYGALELDRPAALVRPGDMAAMPELKCVFRGTLAQLQARRNLEPSLRAGMAPA